jgi:hypothetical protein
MAPSSNDVATNDVSMQTEFMGIKDWACEPSKLGLTPKEIEKQLNGIGLSILVILSFHRY